MGVFNSRAMTPLSPVLSRSGCPSPATPHLSRLPQRRRRRRRRQGPLVSVVVVLNAPLAAAQTIPGAFRLDSCDHGLLSQAERSRPQGNAHPPGEFNHSRAHRVANVRFLSLTTPSCCFIGGATTRSPPPSMLLATGMAVGFPPPTAAPHCWRWWCRVWNVGDRDEADAADTRNPQGSEHEGVGNPGAYPVPEQGHRCLEGGTRRHVLVRHGLGF